MTFCEDLEAYNTKTKFNIDCKNKISQNWNNCTYILSFNQMLNFKVTTKNNFIMKFTEAKFSKTELVIVQHYKSFTDGGVFKSTLK